MYPHVETATGVDCEMAGVGHKYGDGRRGELAGRVGWVWWWWLRREMNWREREESRGGASVPGCVLDSKDQPQRTRRPHTPHTRNQIQNSTRRKYEKSPTHADSPSRPRSGRSATALHRRQPGAGHALALAGTLRWPRPPASSNSVLSPPMSLYVPAQVTCSQPAIAPCTRTAPS